MQPDAERIRERAYHLWEAAEKPEGQHEDFWLIAERQLGDDEADYDKALADSFPASDPPANSGITGPEVAPASAPTTGNEPAGVDPGGTRPTQSGVGATQTVQSGDRNGKTSSNL